MLGIIGLVNGMNAEGGIDVQAAPGGRLHLGLADGGMQGIELAVDIGGTNGIPVHKGQLAYAGASQSLHGIAAHAAQTEYRHMAARQGLHGGIAQDHAGAQKNILHSKTSKKQAGEANRRPAQLSKRYCRGCGNKLRKISPHTSCRSLP